MIVSTWSTGERTRWSQTVAGDTAIWTTALLDANDAFTIVSAIADITGLQVRSAREAKPTKPGMVAILRQRIWVDVWLANRRETFHLDPLAEVVEVAWQHVDRLRENKHRLANFPLASPAQVV